MNENNAKPFAAQKAKVLRQKVPKTI
jgi:hypothetical protein